MTPRCTTPIQSGDTRYVYGECTWHGPIASAGVGHKYADVSSHGEDLELQELQVPCCPRCGGRLLEAPTEDAWWSAVRSREHDLPGYEAMLRWSQGMCFPDFETLQNAYRQAMEGQC